MWTIYRWLLFGSRTLTLTELEAAMCLETGVSSWHDFAGDLSFLCGSLIRVGGPQDEVSFVHQTARGFLEAFITKASATDLGEVEMDAHTVNEHLAAICVQYLLLRDEMFSELKQLLQQSHSRYDGSKLLEDYLESYPFLRYTIGAWAIYARAVCVPSSTFAAMIRTFISSATRRDGIMIFKYFLESGLCSSDEIAPIHVAANFNILWLARMYILDDGNSVHAINRSKDTPLILASRTGSTEFARILLEAGADPNHSSIRWPALHLAAFKGHIGVVTLLLDYGARLDKQDGYGLTPLDFAISWDNWNVVDILVQWAEKARKNLKDLMRDDNYYTWKVWREMGEMGENSSENSQP